MKKKASKWILPMLFILLGGVCGLLIGKYMDRLVPEGSGFGEVLLRLGLLLLAFYALIFLQIAMHEAGHLVFGLLTGYRFISYRLGSFMWMKKDGKIRLFRFSLAGTGGQCLLDPPDYQDGQYPVVLYNLGGCLMNLISAAILSCGALALRKHPAGEMLCIMAALVGLAFAVMNGIPLPGGLLNNDGSNTLEVCKDPAARRAFWIQMRVNASQSNGMRLKAMPAEWFDMPQEAEIRRSALTASLAAFRANRLMDERRFAQAEELMRQLTDGDNAVPGVYRYLLTCDRLYCELIQKNRKEKVEALLTAEQKRSMKTMKNLLTVIRTEYCLKLLNDRDDKGAKAVLQRFETVSRKYPYAVEVEGERELINLAEESFRQI